MISTSERDEIGGMLEGLSYVDFRPESAVEDCVNEVMLQCEDMEIDLTTSVEERRAWVETAVFVKMLACRHRIAGRIAQAKCLEDDLERLITYDDEEVEVLMIDIADQRAESKWEEDDAE